MNNKEIYSAFKKCNQIGKKMSVTGNYLLINGMLLADDTIRKPDEYNAGGLSIAFIDSKICKKLDALAYVGIEVDGNEFYRLSQEGEFDGIAIDTEYLYFYFNVNVVVEDDYIKDIFINDAVSKGHNKDYVLYEYENGFSDIDLYESYLNMKKTMKLEKKITLSSLRCKIITEKNKCLHKFNKIINRLSDSKFIAYKELPQEIYDKLFESDSPVEFHFNDDLDSISIRMMKSLLKTATSKSHCEFRILKHEDFYYLIIEVTTSGIIVCNIYKVVNI